MIWQKESISLQIRFLDKLEMTKGVARNDKGSRFLDKLEMTRE